MKSYTKHVWFIFLMLILFITGCSGSNSIGGSTNTLPNTKGITEYSLNGTVGVITDSNIKVTMPLGTSLASLTATFILLQGLV